MNRNIAVIIDSVLKIYVVSRSYETLISVFDLKISRHPYPNFDIKACYMNVK